jgi:hypothetical protein
MGELIPFPPPNMKLTQEESLEYWRIKENIKNAKTLREIRNCGKQIEDFKKRITERSKGEI